MKKSLSTCPTCGGQLKISQYCCPECEIEINGEFEGCIFCNLNDEDRYFGLVFLQTGGNIKAVECVMGISYPTVKAKLSQLLRNLGVGNGDSAECCEGDRLKGLDRHTLRAEIRVMKRGLKEKIHKKIRDRIHGGMRQACIGIEKEVEDMKPKDKRQTKDVLACLKAGNIDVATALNRLKGKGNECKDDSPKNDCCDAENIKAGCCDEISETGCCDEDETKTEGMKI